MFWTASIIVQVWNQPFFFFDIEMIRMWLNPETGVVEYSNETLRGKTKLRFYLNLLIVCDLFEKIAVDFLNL